MAIQEIEKKEAQGTAGIKRKINAAAEGLVMDIVQAQQYTKPIPSTVRELTANAVDSQSEKQRAIEILSGKAKEEDYFIKREGELYADSNWNPEYYDMNHLNQNENDVTLTYVSRQGSGRCDSFIVRDEGVGIGQRRLEGVLEIGYSTKRNRKDALGAFGLGAKVGLATGSDYYKLTTVYNGVLYKIQIFNKKLNSLIGKLNLDNGSENIPYMFTDGSIIYGEPTNLKNFTEIEVPTLKHHRQDYITAVKTQLLYFPNVNFFTKEIDENGENTNKVNFKANKLYDSKNLVISDNSPYSKPHVVIVKGGDGGPQTGVCYGHIDFKELEIQDMNGDIGVKCPIRQVMEDEEGNEVVINDGVDVVPSRESIRWTPATRDFIKKQFVAAQEESTEIIQDQLKETDFLKWIDACRNVTFGGNRNSVLSRLSRIIELHSLRPKYLGKTEILIKFGMPSQVFDHFTVKVCHKIQDKDGKYQVKREEMSAWNDCSIQAIYLKEGNTVRTKDIYLTDQNNGLFVTLIPQDDEHINLKVKDLVSRNKLKFENIEKKAKEFKTKRDEIIRLMKASTWYKNYDEIDVPDDYLKTLKQLEEKNEDEAERKRVLTPAEKRKLEERTVANTLKPVWGGNNKDGVEYTYSNSKVEPKIKNIEDYEGQMYYGFQSDLSKLHMAAHILDNHLENVQKGAFHGEHYSLLSISKSNKKYFAEKNHINDFFGKAVLVKDDEDKIKGLTIMFDNAVTLWNTARKIYPYMQELKFLKNFSNFDEEISKEYKELSEYVQKNYVDLSGYKNRFGMQEHYEDFTNFLDQVQELQEFAETETDPAKITEKVKDIVLSGGNGLPDGVIGGIAVDTSKIRSLEKLLTYAKPVKDLLNNIPLLTEEGKTMEIETSLLIDEYLEFKGLKKVNK